MNKKYVSLALLAGASVGAIIPAFADNNSSSNNQNRQDMRNHGQGITERQNNQVDMRGRGMMTRPTVTGTVTAISGTTITIYGHQGMAGTSSPQTTFTIDATNAIVMKNKATSTLSAITVGNQLHVSGTLTETTVVATMIRDGAIPLRGEKGGVINNQNTQAITELKGNGQPVVAGQVTAINGTILTVTNKANVTYTVEAGTSKVIVDGNTSTLGSVKVGDMVILQGAVNGTQVIATTLIDNGTTQTQNTGNSQAQNKPQRGGFFGGIGNFFGKFFGF